MEQWLNWWISVPTVIIIRQNFLWSKDVTVRFFVNPDSNNEQTNVTKKSFMISNKMMNDVF